MRSAPLIERVELAYAQKSYFSLPSLAGGLCDIAKLLKPPGMFSSLRARALSCTPVLTVGRTRRNACTNSTVTSVSGPGRRRELSTSSAMPVRLAGLVDKVSHWNYSSANLCAVAGNVIEEDVMYYMQEPCPMQTYGFQVAYLQYCSRMK